MESIWIFETDKKGIKIENSTAIRTETLNGVEEELHTELYINENIEDYVRCNLVVDEIKSIKARALGKDLNGVIVKNRYEAFYRESDGNLVVYANKNAALIIKQIFNDKFDFDYKARTIVLEEVINSSNNVRKAQFKDVKIETLTGGMINGDQVHNTEIFGLMDDSGNLSTVGVVYPLFDKEVSFTISIYGSILLYTNLTYEECLELIKQLLEL